ncbi:MAG TPA: type II secretion system protein [Usitatibacteraceae bacterium]
MTVPIMKNRYSMGFSLIEIAIVLVIIGLLATFALGVTSQVLNKQRRDTTIARLALIDSALTLYVAQNKFLPCPADGTIPGTVASPNPLLGVERVSPSATAPAASRTSCSLASQQNGILPWITLGIALADAQDGWGNMFTYRVDESLVVSGSMDFTNCTPAGTAAAAGTTPNLTCAVPPLISPVFPTSYSPTTAVTAGRGLRVKNFSGNQTLNDPSSVTGPPSTGAAYVVISHGENQAGAYQYSGTLNTGFPASSLPEQQNYASNSYSPIASAYLVDDATNYGDPGTHFDDFVLRPSILAVANKAQLGPRAY